MHSNQQKIRPEAKFFIQTVIINAVIVSFASGYTMVYFNAIPFDQLYQIFQLTFNKPLAQGLLTGCIPASACIGALLIRFLLNTFSRKNCFYVLNILLIVAIGCIQTKYIIMVFVGRILQGTFVGASSGIVPLYIKQFIPQMNGKYGLYNQLSFTIGIVFAFGLSLIFHTFIQNPQQYWRYHFLFPLIMIFLQMMMTFFKFNNQTPRYLISQNRLEEAKDLLQKIYTQKYAEQQFKTLFEAVKSKSQLIRYEEEQGAKQKQQSSKQTQQNREQSSQNINQNKNNNVIIFQNQQNEENFKQIIHKNYQPHLRQHLIPKTKSKKPLNNKLAIFCALHLSFQQQIIGIGAVIVYSGDIIKEIVPEVFHYYSLIVHSFGLCCVVLGVFLIRKLGRVTMIQGGGVIICLSLTLIGINFLLEENRVDMLILVAVILVRGAFSCTLGPIVWLYMAQIIKPNIFPYGTFLNWFSATAVMLLYPIVKDYLGNPGWIFIFNAIMCGTSTLINYFTLIQTKDKNELVIRKQFDEKLQKLGLCKKQVQ